jgi:hypothetical protein
MYLNIALIGRLNNKSNRNVMARQSLRQNGKVSAAVIYAKCITRLYGLNTNAVESTYVIPLTTLF